MVTDEGIAGASAAFPSPRSSLASSAAQSVVFLQPQAQRMVSTPTSVPLASGPATTSTNAAVKAPRRRRKHGERKADFYTTRDRDRDANELAALRLTLERCVEQLEAALSREEAAVAARKEQVRKAARRSVAEELRSALKSFTIGDDGAEDLTEDDKERVRLALAETNLLLDEGARLEHDLRDSAAQRQLLSGALRDEIAAKKRAVELQIGENVLKKQKLLAAREDLVRQYWTWRQRREIGDATAAPSFAQELERGPRFRDVAVQNEIQADFLPRQVLKMVQMMKREQVFRHQVNQIQSLVLDIEAVNRSIRAELTCALCGGIFAEPLLMWPCGHSFCAACFDTLSVGPSVFRCHTCGTLGTEGATPNLSLNDLVGRWLFQTSGFSNLTLSVDGVVAHLDKFRRVEVEKRLGALSASIAMSLSLNQY